MADNSQPPDLSKLSNDELMAAWEKQLGSLSPAERDEAMRQLSDPSSGLASEKRGMATNIFRGLGDDAALAADAAAAIPRHLYYENAHPGQKIPSFLENWQRNTPASATEADSYWRSVGQGLPFGLLGPAGGEGLGIGSNILARTGATTLSRAIPSLGEVGANAALRSGVYGALPAVTGKMASDFTHAAYPHATIGNVTDSHISPEVGSTLPNFLRDVPMSEVAGMAVSGLNPGAARAQRFITPFVHTDPRRAAAAQAIFNETGSYPTVGQIFRDPNQINRELAARPNINDEQASLLTQAYSRRVNPNNPASEITGQWLGNEGTRIGNVRNTNRDQPIIDPMAGGTPGVSSTNLYNGLSSLSSDAIRNRNPHYIDNVLQDLSRLNSKWTPTGAPSPGAPPGLTSLPTLPEDRLHDALFGNAVTGSIGPSGSTMGGRRSMSASDYQLIRDALLHKASTLDRMDPGQANFYRGVVNSLDTGTNDTASPVLNDWRTNQQQQLSLRTIEDAAEAAARRSGPSPITLNPTNMNRADIRNSGFRSVASGDTPFSELSRAADTAYRPLEQGPPPPPGVLGRLGKYALGLAGAGATKVFGEPAIGAMIAMEGRGRNPPSFNYSGSVGMEPWQQAWGRNQLFPRREIDNRHRQLLGVVRALGLPQQELYNHPNSQ